MLFRSLFFTFIFKASIFFRRISFSLFHSLCFSSPHSSAMALLLQLWLLHLFFFLFLSLSTVCYCQLTPPQNIETFYPPPIISPPPSSPLDHPPSSSSPSTSTRTIVTAVAVTAVGMALISSLFFFLIQKYLIRRKRKTEEVNSGLGQGPATQPAVAQSDFSRLDGNLKGFIVDENGLDVIYWKRLERRKSKNSFDRGDGEGNVKGNRSKKSEPVQEIPLLRGKSSTSHVKIAPEDEEPSRITSPPPPPPPPKINHPPPFTGNSVQAVGKPSSSSILSSTAPSQPAPIQVPPSQSLMAVPNNKSSVPPPPPPIPVKTNSRPPPPPPPIPAKTNSRPPPPPPIPAKTNSAAPPPPPIPGKENPAAPPPPPPKAGTSKLPLRPAPPKGDKSSGEASSSADNGQVKMKPLHWDKVNTANADHSMVWDKMNGSFK